MTGELRVVAEELRGRSRSLKAVPWPEFDGQGRITAPSGLPFSEVAADNVWQNFGGLRRFQKAGQIEGVRLAESLDICRECLRAGRRRLTAGDQ